MLDEDDLAELAERVSADIIDAGDEPLTREQEDRVERFLRKLSQSTTTMASLGDAFPNHFKPEE